MNILTEIFRDQSLNIHGKTDCREAVRAVVIRGDRILMVYSPVNSDYKFPGGGVDKNESPEVALKREVLEECGMHLTKILQEIGCVIEYLIPLKAEFDVFKMTSSYYLCQVNSTIEKQNLDPYEEALGFQPAWVEIETALQVNKALLRSTKKESLRWTAREVFMLEYIQSHLF